MIKEYNTWKETMEALLAGKKLTRKDWYEKYYIHMVDNEIAYEVDSVLIGNSLRGSCLASISRDGWVEYSPPEEKWDWKVGDVFDYDDIVNTTRHEVLFVNEDVMFCRELRSKKYYRFYNESTIKRYLCKVSKGD